MAVRNGEEDRIGEERSEELDFNGLVFCVFFTLAGTHLDVSMLKVAGLAGTPAEAYDLFQCCEVQDINYFLDENI